MVKPGIGVSMSAASARSTLPATPPPPPTDCAKMPFEAMPNVSIVAPPCWVTVTSPPSPAAPPLPPTPTVPVRPVTALPPTPPPPPTDWAKMPFELAPCVVMLWSLSTITVPPLPLEPLSPPTVDLEVLVEGDRADGDEGELDGTGRISPEPRMPLPPLPPPPPTDCA